MRKLCSVVAHLQFRLGIKEPTTLSYLLYWVSGNGCSLGMCQKIQNRYFQHFLEYKNPYILFLCRGYFCPALTKLALDLHVKMDVCVCVCLYFRSFSVTNFQGF